MKFRNIVGAAALSRWAWRRPRPRTHKSEYKLSIVVGTTTVGPGAP